MAKTNNNLKGEVKNIIRAKLGETVAEEAEHFEDANKYPHDFLQQSLHFLSLLIGKDAAIKSLEPVAKKYKINF